MIFKGPDGNPIMVDYSQFHFKWVKDHYLLPASTFVYNKKGSERGRALRLSVVVRLH
jgi:hypothetical protein